MRRLASPLSNFSHQHLAFNISWNSPFPPFPPVKSGFIRITDRRSLRAPRKFLVQTHRVGLHDSTVPRFNGSTLAFLQSLQCYVKELLILGKILCGHLRELLYVSFSGCQQGGDRCPTLFGEHVAVSSADFLNQAVSTQ